MSDKPTTKPVVVLSSTTFASLGTSDLTDGKKSSEASWSHATVEKDENRVPSRLGRSVVCLFLSYDRMLRISGLLKRHGKNQKQNKGSKKDDRIISNRRHVWCLLDSLPQTSGF